MALRERTLSIIGITIIILTAMLLFTANKILLTGFETLERQEVNQNLKRSQNVLQAELSSLDDFAQDWAFWDETYEFIAEPNEDYIKRNWVQSTFISERLNAVVVMNSEGRVVYGKGFDLAKRLEVTLPEGMAVYADKLRIQDSASKVSGIIMLPSGPMLVAVRPVLDNSKQMPVNGTIVIGRYLDKAKLNDLAGTAQLNLSLEAFNKESTLEDFAAARSNLSLENQTFIQPLNIDTIAGYLCLSDIDQKPALILRVDTPRHIYQQGQTTIRYLIAAFLIIGLAFGLTHIMIIKRIVLDRLITLSSRVQDIGRSGSPSERVDVVGDDELSDLSRSINNMLHSLEAAEYELRASEAINRALLEKFPDSVLLIDRTGTILDFKTGKHRCAAVPPLLFPGKKLSEIYPPDITYRFMINIERAISSQTQQVYEQEFCVDNCSVYQEIRIDISGQDEVIAVIRDFPNHCRS